MLQSSLKSISVLRIMCFLPAAFPSIQMFTGRGCPARCNFCVYPQTLHGHKYRLRTPENVIGEIEYILENFPEVKEIVFEDDTFTINKSRVTEICNLLIQKGIHKKIRWLCNARVNLDYDTMVLMKKAGCHLIIPGIESVNQTILNNIRKGTTVEQIENYIANARKAGLMVHACYMVGNNGETRETMEQTLAAAMRFKTDTAQFFPLIPYPGTEAYEWARATIISMASMMSMSTRTVRSTASSIHQRSARRIWLTSVHTPERNITCAHGILRIACGADYRTRKTSSVRSRRLAS